MLIFQKVDWPSLQSDFIKLFTAFQIGKYTPLLKTQHEHTTVEMYELANRYLDLVSSLHVQVRLMGNFGLMAVFPGLQILMANFFCKNSVENAIFSWIAPVLEIILNLSLVKPKPKNNSL